MEEIYQIIDGGQIWIIIVFLVNFCWKGVFVDSLIVFIVYVGVFIFGKIYNIIDGGQSWD